MLEYIGGYLGGLLGAGNSAIGLVTGLAGAKIGEAIETTETTVENMANGASQFVSGINEAYNPVKIVKRSLVFYAVVGILIYIIYKGVKK